MTESNPLAKPDSLKTMSETQAESWYEMEAGRLIHRLVEAVKLTPRVFVISTEMFVTALLTLGLDRKTIEKLANEAIAAAVKARAVADEKFDKGKQKRRAA